jgi:uncharacterized protein
VAAPPTRHDAAVLTRKRDVAMPRITALNIYPVKSCRGIALERARVTSTGFEHDRQWMIIRADGRFVTQREEPRLALIETALTTDALRLGAPGCEALFVPFAAAERQLEVVCWRDRCAALDAGVEAAAWLSSYLGEPMRLVRFDPRGKRASDATWTQGVEALNQFTDGFPWLLISQASLDDLNRRLPTPLPMNRFRPNIVMDGLPAYGEDSVNDFVLDGVRLKPVKPCTRCTITTTDQSTGERLSDEPLRTLREYRFSRELKGLMFGQNLILLDGAGRELSVGQHATIR